MCPLSRPITTLHRQSTTQKSKYSCTIKTFTDTIRAYILPVCCDCSVVTQIGQSSVWYADVMNGTVNLCCCLIPLTRYNLPAAWKVKNAFLTSIHAEVSGHHNYFLSRLCLFHCRLQQTWRQYLFTARVGRLTTAQFSIVQLKAPFRVTQFCRSLRLRCSLRDRPFFSLYFDFIFFCLFPNFLYRPIFHRS